MSNKTAEVINATNVTTTHGTSIIPFSDLAFILIIFVIVLMLFFVFLPLLRQIRAGNNNVRNLTANRLNSNEKVYSNSFKKNKSKRFCGVEIECIQEEETDPIENKDLNENNFSAGNDSSLSLGGIEFRSRPMQGDELFDNVGEFISKLNERGYKIDSSCGFHIHLEVPFSLELIKKIYIFYSNYENIFFDMLPKSRQNNKHCEKIKKHDSFSLNDIINTKSLTEFMEIFYETKDYSRDRFNNYYEKKYCWINFHSMFCRGTLEIRAHSGTLNKTKALNWMEIHLQILDFLQKTSLSKVIKMKSKKEFMQIFRPEIRNYIKRRYKEQISKIQERQFKV